MSTYSQNPSADTKMRSNVPTTNDGTLNTLGVGENNASAQIIRSLVQFDLSSIASNATINSATLSVFEQGTDLTDNTRSFDVFRTLRAWTETGATWNTYDGTNNWTTAGCGGAGTDYNSTSLGSVSLPNPPAAEGTQYDVTLNTALIKELIDGTMTNNGFILKMQTETNDLHNLYSREASGAQAGYKPVLTIDYTIPGGAIVATRALLGVGG
jgi:hypothetical protein